MSSEKELDRALEDALKTNIAFCRWFLSRTKAGHDYTHYDWSRSNHPWGKVRVLLPNSETGALEMAEREGETDVLAVFEGPSKRRLGVHIENKLASGSFTQYQPEVCAARADAWIHNPAYGNYDHWETVLLAPTSFYQRFTTEARKFTSFISHEDVAEYVPVFRA